MKPGAGVSNRIVYFPDASSLEKAEKIDVVANTTIQVKAFTLAPRQR